MSLYSFAFDRIFGGWKTWGPNAMTGNGAYASDASTIYQPVGKVAAMRIMAYYSCLKIRAETTACFPIQILDSKNNVVSDHPLYGVLRTSPNPDQTGPEYISAMVANADMFGFGVSRINRWANGEVYGLDFYPTDQVLVKEDEKKRPVYTIDGKEYSRDKVLVTPIFGTDGRFGIGTLQAGRNVLAGQVAANDAAAVSFRNGGTFGGFIKLPDSKRPMTPDQLDDFESRMSKYSTPEKRGKFFTLLPGMEVVPGAQFKISMADLELLSSRQFGIEEICRLFGVPPPLIGQTNKASSWASSLDALNQHFVTYSLQPTTTRLEARIAKQLFTDEDRAKGLRIKFNMNSLLRGDVVKRLQYYKTMQGELGNLTANQVLALEDLPDIGPEGDIRRVMLSTAPATGEDQTNSTGKNENEDENA